MSQCVQIMAFRKRAKKRGYKDISIKQTEDSDVFLFSAIEPVLGLKIEGEITVVRMMSIFKKNY